MNKYALAANLIAQVQRVHPEFIERAGARHSATDRVLVQQLHDIAMELGAECHHDEGEMMSMEEMRRYAPHPMLKAAVEALVLRHPGHGNQKVHGNRFGGYGTTKESLRRLKDDKGAREAYKKTARKRAGGGQLSETDLPVKIGETIKVSDEFSSFYGQVGKVIGIKEPKYMSELIKPKAIVNLEGDIRPDNTPDKRYFEFDRLRVMRRK